MCTQTQASQETRTVSWLFICRTVWRMVELGPFGGPKELHNMVDFRQTRKILNGRFTLVSFETAVNRELKVVKEGSMWEGL